MSSRVDKIWTGHLLPMTVTQGGVTTHIGLALADWQRPMELVSAALKALLDAAYPLEAWDVVRAAGGAITIRSTALFSVTFLGGFNLHLGFSLSSYFNVVLITSDLNPTYQTMDVRLGYSLPGMIWHRAVIGERQPVIWGGPFFIWDFTWYQWRWSLTSPNVSILRQPFVVCGANTDPWDLDNRDGYIACRPLAEGAMRRPVGSTADWGSAIFRARWLAPQIAVT